MTVIELLKACAEAGDFVKVSHKGKVGIVTTFKGGGSHFKGCAVRFDDKTYDDWFWDSDETDNRRKYMRDLSFFPNEQTKIDL